MSARYKYLLSLLFLVFFMQGCVDPYNREPVDQVVNTPADIWNKIARTHAP